MDKKQFKEYIIRPTLKEIGLHSLAAENLLLGTALVESNLEYVQQLGGGPAIGVYQMEPATHRDIWNNYLRHRPDLANCVNDFLSPSYDKLYQLRGNLHYATAMARVHYLRVPKALPLADDAEGLAQYHKDYYNTHLGKTDVSKSIEHFKRAIL